MGSKYINTYILGANQTNKQIVATTQSIRDTIPITQTVHTDSVGSYCYRLPTGLIVNKQTLLEQSISEQTIMKQTICSHFEFVYPATLFTFTAFKHRGICHCVYKHLYLRTLLLSLHVNFRNPIFNIMFTNSGVHTNKQF